MDLDDVLQRLLAFREARDWAKFHNAKDLALSVSIEAAELLELFQWKSASDVKSLAHKAVFQEKAAGEIADVLIYLVLLAHELNIDPVSAALTKIEMNQERFPLKA